MVTRKATKQVHCAQHAHKQLDHAATKLKYCMTKENQEKLYAGLNKVIYKEKVNRRATDKAKRNERWTVKQLRTVTQDNKKTRAYLRGYCKLSVYSIPAHYDTGKSEEEVIEMVEEWMKPRTLAHKQLLTCCNITPDRWSKIKAGARIMVHEHIAIMKSLLEYYRQDPKTCNRIKKVMLDYLLIENRLIHEEAKSA
jgi:hypothetical protein